MVVHWHKLDEVDNKSTSHNFIFSAIRVPEIIKFGGDSTKFWQNKLRHFLAHPVLLSSSPITTNIYRQINTDDQWLHISSMVVA